MSSGGYTNKRDHSKGSTYDENPFSPREKNSEDVELVASYMGYEPSSNIYHPQHQHCSNQRSTSMSNQHYQDQNQGYLYENDKYSKSTSSRGRGGAGAAAAPAVKALLSQICSYLLPYSFRVLWNPVKLLGCENFNNSSTIQAPEIPEAFAGAGSASEEEQELKLGSSSTNKKNKKSKNKNNSDIDSNRCFVALSALVQCLFFTATVSLYLADRTMIWVIVCLVPPTANLIALLFSFHRVCIQNRGYFLRKMLSQKNKLDTCLALLPGFCNIVFLLAFFLELFLWGFAEQYAAGSLALGGKGPSRGGDRPQSRFYYGNTGADGSPSASDDPYSENYDWDMVENMDRKRVGGANKYELLNEVGSFLQTTASTAGDNLEVKKKSEDLELN